MADSADTVDTAPISTSAPPVAIAVIVSDERAPSVVPAPAYPPQHRFSKHYARRARHVRNIVRLILFTLTLLGTLAVVAPDGPGVGGYLSAAASARAGLRYDRALAFYATASAESPADPRPYCASGDVRALQQEWRDAIAAYRACIARAAGDTQTGAAGWLGLGNALSTTGDDASAENAWRHAERMGSHEASQRLGLLYERQSRFDDALRAWAALPADDPQAREHLGLFALWRGDYAAARADFVALRAEPNAYADEMVDNGFLVLAARPPQDAASFSLLGYRFLAIGLPSLSLAPLRASLALAPQDGATHAYLGWALWVLGRPSDARQEIATGLRLAPRLSFAWYATGQLALADDNAQRAADAFDHAAALDPNNSVIWAASGRLALGRHDYITGELALERAAELSHDPADTIALLQLYADSGLHLLTTDRARQAALDAVRRFPDSEPIRYLLAAVYDHIGQLSFAYYAARDAIALDPTDPAPYVLLGRYAFNSGDYVTAALDLRLALALRPHGPQADEARALLAPIEDIAV
ncbi:MAG TPA: tetratricopeptide repeat protein [Ktedonobacterales bacterium]